MICKKCGHSKTMHTIISGPNSIGQFTRDLCSVGTKEIGPYEDLMMVMGGCSCPGFELRWWWPLDIKFS